MSERMSEQSAQETTQDAASVNGPPRRPQVAVGAVLTDIIGRVLLIQRGQQPNYGKWTLPGGRVEWGETLEQALARELQAETGLRARMGPLAEILEYIDERFHYIILDYHMSEPEGTLQAGEDALAARFVTLEEAATLSTTPELMAMLRRVLPTAASRPTR